MKRSISLGKAVVAVLLAVVVTVVVTAASLGAFSQVGSLSQKLSKLQRVVARSHLETEQTEQQTLEDAVAAGYVAGLGDPYAAYYSEEAYLQKQQAESGVMVGVGVSVSPGGGGLMIHTVFADSPAAEADLRPQDCIIAVDGQLLDTMLYEDAVALVRGEEGSSVALTVMRGEETFIVETVRRAVSMPTVTLTMLGEIAYVAIDDFTDETLPQLETAIADLTEAGATGIVFDLRDNGGGLLNAVIDVLDVLLPAGVLVTTVDVNGVEEVRGESDADCVTLPMVCLINEKTASAAELFVAALRDYDYTEIVGETSYGKGVMQNTFALDDGSAVKITTAYFNPPSGENFNGVGIEPDVSLPLTDEQRAAMQKGDPESDTQLAGALALLS